MLFLHVVILSFQATLCIVPYGYVLSPPVDEKHAHRKHGVLLCTGVVLSTQ